MSTTLLTLDQMLLEAIGDFLQHPVTTALAASTALVSTHLPKYRSSADHYNRYWCYIEDNANIGVDFNIADDDGTNTLSARTAFTAEASTATMATFRLSRFSWADRIRAIETARKQIYPDLFRYLDNRDLVTGNLLPPFNWATTATLDVYTEPTGTLLKNTDSTYIRRGSSSAKVTASGNDDPILINSHNYPRLLDLQGKTIDFKCWVYPEVANEAELTIYTVKTDGTTQTLTSTTTCLADKHTLLELEAQSINDDLTLIQFGLNVPSDTKYVYFDQPRVTGRDIHEYLLPTDFQDGFVSRVYIQTSGYSDDICDDLHPRYWEEVYGYEIIDDGTYKYLRLPYLYSNERQIRLIGYHPLEDLLAGASTTWAANTITPDGKEIELLIAYAKYILYKQRSQPASSEDRARYKEEEASAFWEYKQLSNLKMITPRMSMNLRT